MFLNSDFFKLIFWEKLVKVSIKKLDINPLYCVSLPGYTWQCGMKSTDKKLQTLQNKDMILLLENKISGGFSSVVGDRYVKSHENEKTLSVDADKICGWAMSQSLSNDEIVCDRNINLEDLFHTPDDINFSYFLKVDLKCPSNRKGKTMISFFAP